MRPCSVCCFPFPVCVPCPPYLKMTVKVTKLSVRLEPQLCRNSIPCKLNGVIWCLKYIAYDDQKANRKLSDSLPNFHRRTFNANYRHKILVWNNVWRWTEQVGPMVSENLNQLYISNYFYAWKQRKSKYRIWKVKVEWNPGRMKVSLSYESSRPIHRVFGAVRGHQRE